MFDIVVEEFLARQTCLKLWAVVKPPSDTDFINIFTLSD